MESSKDISEEKVIDNESKKSQSDEVPEKPVSVAGIGTNVSAAPTVRETRKPRRSRQEEKIKTKNDWPTENF